MASFSEFESGPSHPSEVERLHVEQPTVFSTDASYPIEAEPTLEQRFFKLEATTAKIEKDCEKLKAMASEILSILSTNIPETPSSKSSVVEYKSAEKSKLIETKVNVKPWETAKLEVKRNSIPTTVAGDKRFDEESILAESKQKREEREMREKEAIERLEKERQQAEKERKKRLEFDAKTKSLISTLVTNKNGSKLFGEDKKDKSSIFDD